jgi:hypothetical protein
MIVGVIGNGLIITSVVIIKELRENPTCILITNLAIADLSISTLVNLSTVLGEYILLEKSW